MTELEVDTPGDLAAVGVPTEAEGGDPWRNPGGVHLESDVPEIIVRPSAAHAKARLASWMNEVEFRDAFWSRNIPEDVPFGFKENLLTILLPMLVGPIWSEERRNDFKRLLKTFVFWLSIIQLLMFFVSLLPHGPTWFLGPPKESLVMLGAKIDDRIIAGEIYRFFTPVFLHAGLLHLVINLFAQFRLSLGFEVQWGLEAFFFIFVASTVGGVVLSCLSSADVNVASTAATCGVIGARISEMVLTWSDEPAKQRIVNIGTTFTLLFLLGLVGFLPNVDNGAHLGGAFAGFVLGWVFFVPRHTEKEVWRMGTLFAGVLILIVVYGLIATLFFAIRGIDR